MIVPSSVQCVTNLLLLTAHLNYIIGFKLVTKHTQVQHVRILSLAGSILCNIYDTVW